MFYGFKKVNGELVWGEAKDRKILEEHNFPYISPNEYEVMSAIFDDEESKYTGYRIENSEIEEYCGTDYEELKDAGCFGITEKYDAARVKIASTLGKEAFLKSKLYDDFGYNIFHFMYCSRVYGGSLWDGEKQILRVLSPSKGALEKDEIKEIAEYMQVNSIDDDNALYELEFAEPDRVD